MDGRAVPCEAVDEPEESNQIIFVDLSLLADQALIA
tara:strand:- start:360 stop:467 length:108 start_codon:yes stop_codon:yes gene_type:complete